MIDLMVFSRVLGILSLFACLLMVLRVPGGMVGGMLWLPKLWASSWSPVFLGCGMLAAGMGIYAKDIIAIISGCIGSVLGAYHIFMVTRPPGGFEAIYGSGWEKNIPPSMRSRLWKKRYLLVQPAGPVIRGEKNIVIGGPGSPESALLCDLWKPPENIEPSGMALIFFHGGLWQAVDKDFLTQPLFRRLCGEGHVIMDVAYSLAPSADLNCMLGEVKQAILWMKAHCREYHVNPERIVLMGVSGGAHLALLAAYAPDHPAFRAISPGADMSVRAVISLFGISDLCAFFEEYGKTTKKQPEYSSEITPDLLPRIHDRTWMERMLTKSRAFPAYRHANMPGGALLLVNLMGGTLKEIPEVYRLASPIAHAGPHCPPTLQVFDANDFVVDASQGRRLHQALLNAGATSVYIEIPQTVHGFDQYIGVSRRFAPAAQSVTFDLERFLALQV